jgi:hypothetical protein
MIGKPLHQIPSKSDPIGGRVKLKIRQFDLSITQVFKGIELDLFISNNTGGHSHLTMFEDCPLLLLSLKSLQYGNIGVIDRIRVIVPMGLLDVSPSIRIIELLYGIEF